MFRVAPRVRCRRLISDSPITDAIISQCVTVVASHKHRDLPTFSLLYLQLFQYLSAPSRKPLTLLTRDYDLLNSNYSLSFPIHHDVRLYRRDNPAPGAPFYGRRPWLTERGSGCQCQQAARGTYRHSHITIAWVREQFGLTIMTQNELESQERQPRLQLRGGGLFRTLSLFSFPMTMIFPVLGG